MPDTESARTFDAAQCTPQLRKASRWLDFYTRDSWAPQLERLEQLPGE